MIFSKRKKCLDDHEGRSLQRQLLFGTDANDSCFIYYVYEVTGNV